jgi:hypothetical protein
MVLGWLADVRDVIIVLWGFFSLIALLFFLFVTWTLYRGFKGLIETVKVTVNDDVKPILSLSQDSVNNASGTVRFLGDSVARPAVRSLSFMAGARRAFLVFTGLTGRGRTG